MPDKQNEVPNLTHVELQDLLDKWQRTHGTEKLNRQGMPYFQITDMMTAMNSLVLTFIGIGYSEQQIRSESLSKSIQLFCTPYKYAGKLKEWREQINRHWVHAIRERFPSKFEIVEAKEVKYDKAKVSLEKPEMHVPRNQPTQKNRPEAITKAGVLGKGFGKNMDIILDVDPLAELDGDNNE